MPAATSASLSPWPLPQLDDANRAFWTGGRLGQLRIASCTACNRAWHPSLRRCPDCLGPVGDRTVAGRGVVVACTVNHQAWMPGLAPYPIAIVDLADAPGVRLTTRLVQVDPDRARVGMKVRVAFEPREDVWLPLFEEDPDAGAALGLVLPAGPGPDRARHRPAVADRYESQAVISGVGASPLGRRLAASELDLTLQACLAAIDDAGLVRDDIDGLAAYPGVSEAPGYSESGVRALEQVLRVRPAWHCGAREVPGQLGGVVGAMLAVAAGLCRHVLCFTAFSTQGAPGIRRPDGAQRIGGEASWSLPFGCATPVHWMALYASHYCATYGVDPDFLGSIAIGTRRNAGRNAAAVYREPLDLAAYRAARVISTPLRLYDCDVPCDGAMAVIVSHAGAAGSLRQMPVRVEAVGTETAEPQSWDQGTLTHQPQVFSAARHLWSRTDLSPRDVDVALLYDGFTFNVVSWIEALGFCAPGQAAAYLDGGRRIAADGDLPLNPHGGQLAAGRSNGFGGLIEAVLQLRGQSHQRQVAGANVAVVSAGGGIPACCMLLRRD